MSVLPKKTKPQHSAIKIILRMVWIISFVLAVYGFVTGKPGFQWFLLTALIAALGAGDISPTSGIVEAIRLYIEKGK